jgi:hypothetical protein
MFETTATERGGCDLQGIEHMRKKWTEAMVAKLLAEGHGSGSGPNYQPWIKVRDISSSGRKHLVPGTRFGREMHFLSDIEYSMFLLLDWSEQVLDINEQFPLDRALTQDVARRLGIPHPCYPGTTVPTVMTCDFMVTLVRNGQTVLEAFNTKPDSDVNLERELVKLEIQRTALELMEIPHHLVVKSSLPEPLATNLGWLQTALVKPEEIEPHYPGYFDDMANRFLSHAGAASPQKSLAQVAKEFDRMHGTDPGTGLRAARILARRKRVKLDLNAVHPADTLMSKFIVAEQTSLRAVGGSF